MDIADKNSPMSLIIQNNNPSAFNRWQFVYVSINLETAEGFSVYYDGVNFPVERFFTPTNSSGIVYNNSLLWIGGISNSNSSFSKLNGSISNLIIADYHSEFYAPFLANRIQSKPFKFPSS